MDIDKVIKLLAQTDGRDKIYKAAANVAKFLAYSNQQSGNKDGAKRAAALAKSIGEGRSLMRMGKWVQNTKKLTDSASSGTVFSAPDTVMEYTRVACDFGYIFGDNVGYLAKYGVVAVSDEKWVAKQSKVFQFYAYVLAVLLDIMKILKLRKQGKSCQASYINLTKNASDALVSADGLGYGRCVGYAPNAGFTSLLGFLSGSIATYQNWQKLSSS